VLTLGPHAQSNDVLGSWQGDAEVDDWAVGANPVEPAGDVQTTAASGAAKSSDFWALGNPSGSRSDP
jgi:hypothetical protein